MNVVHQFLKHALLLVHWHHQFPVRLWASACHCPSKSCLNIRIIVHEVRISCWYTECKRFPGLLGPWCCDGRVVYMDVKSCVARWTSGVLRPLVECIHGNLVADPVGYMLQDPCFASAPMLCAFPWSSTMRLWSSVLWLAYMASHPAVMGCVPSFVLCLHMSCVFWK